MRLLSPTFCRRRGVLWAALLKIIVTMHHEITQGHGATHFFTRPESSRRRSVLDPSHSPYVHTYNSIGVDYRFTGWRKPFSEAVGEPVGYKDMTSTSFILRESSGVEKTNASIAVSRCSASAWLPFNTCHLACLKAVLGPCQLDLCTYNDYCLLVRRGLLPRRKRRAPTA